MWCDEKGGAWIEGEEIGGERRGCDRMGREEVWRGTKAAITQGEM